MVKVTKITRDEIGESGTNIFHGVIQGEEYNTALTGSRATRVFDEMRRSDATVNAGLSAIKLPISQAQYRVDPASDDDSDRDVAEFVDTCLFENIDWQKFVDEALTYLDFGFAVFEMVFESRVVNGQNRIALSKLGFRKQTTIEAWEQEGGAPGIRQFTATGKKYNIPLEKLVVFTHKQEGDNYQGISILRTAYKHWLIKDKLYRIDAIGHERQALGVLEITVPKGATTADKRAMRTAARNVRANEESYIEHPEGWVIGFMDMKAKSLKDVEPSITHHDRQILKNVLAQFLDLGSTGAAGSRATSEDHSRLFELSVQGVAERIAHVLQQTVVKTLVDLNFTGRPYPKLTVGKLADDNVPVISEAISKFVAAGILHPRPDDENAVRRMIGIGQVDRDELEALFDAPTADKAEGKQAAVLNQARQLRASIEGLLYDNQSAAA